MGLKMGWLYEALSSLEGASLLLQPSSEFKTLHLIHLSQWVLWWLLEKAADAIFQNFQ